MLSPSAFRHQLSAFAIAMATIAVPVGAAADAKKTCSDAFHKTQALRRETKLGAAHEQAVICAQATCTKFIRDDCTAWLAELEAAQPTVIFAIRSAEGIDLTDVRVVHNGEPWLDRVDGRSHPLDPGSHTFRFESSESPPTEVTVLLREGDKNRTIAATLGTESKPASPSAASVPSSPSVAPWIVGAVGVGNLIVGSVLAIVVAGERAAFDEHCTVSTKTCDDEGLAALDTGTTLGPVSTVTLVVGSVGVTVAGIWLIARSSHDAAPVTAVLAPVATPTGGAMRLQGRF